MAEPDVSGIFSRMTSSKAAALHFERAAGRLFGAALLATASLACSDDPASKPAESSPGVWVGEVEDSDIKVALAERDGNFTLFFCGGDDSFMTNTHWFAEDALPNAAFSFTDGGWSVNGAVKKGVASGSVQTETDTARGWTAARVDPTTIAGLYAGVAPCGKLGLIVTQATADDEPSGQGTCLRLEASGMIVEQVNPVRLVQLRSTHEIAVTVASAPDQQFTVLPVVGAEQ
jgi:hypothetical protein